MRPQVSFVVPAYNYARYLPECLGSILAQDSTATFEVVIVNDASTDDTPAVLDRLRDPRIRVVHNETNQGHARTIGIAIKAATGKLIARIDPDDRYRREFLSRTLPVFDRHPEVGLVYGDAALIDAEGRFTEVCAPRHGGQAFHGNELVPLLESNFICAPTVIARRECWEAFLPVPEHLAFNDWYFTVMIARRWNLYYVPAVLADYRVHDTQHHTRVAQDGSEERSVRWLLNEVYAAPEGDSALEREKQAARERIWAAQLIHFAEKYFWFGNYPDARRCYLEALRHDASQLMEPRVLRHLAASVIGRKPYEWLKSALRRARPEQRPEQRPEKRGV